MRIVSDITGKSYSSVEDCLAAEKTFVEEQKKAEEEKKALADKKKERAKEVEDAYKKAKEAEKKYYELRNSFVKDYGYYHTTYTNVSDTPFQDLLDFFFTF